MWNYLKSRRRSSPQLAREDWASAEARVHDLAARLTDMETLAAQLQSVLREARIPLPPPKHLQVRVCGTYAPGFIDSGLDAIDDIDAAIEKSGKRAQDFATALDFGCGCGRVLRALRSIAPAALLHGIDIDAEAISWLQANYNHLGAFAVAPHWPPTDFRDGTFDFIYGISVFTHLPEDMQFRWLAELQRITRTGGFVMLSTHGATHYEKLPANLLAIVRRDGFYHGELGFNYGASIALPDFYQTSFHTHEYIQREWTRFFAVVDIQSDRMGGHQDTVLLYRR